MILCPTCYRNNVDREQRCVQCGASLIGITDEQNKQSVRRMRCRNRLRGNMVTGFIICFGLQTFFGIPESVLPGSIILNAIFAAIFGIPLGYLVTSYAKSVVGGAAIGCGIGIVYAAVIALVVTHHFTGSAVIIGISTGLIPGAIMGLHVAME
jgi:hypothetical protein